MKNKLLCSLSLAAGLCAITSGVQAAGVYMYCVVSTATDNSQLYPKMIQGNIAKMPNGQREDVRLLQAQYIDFVNKTHPDWFNGYRFVAKNQKPDEKYIQFQIEKAVSCDGYYESQAKAKASQLALIKETDERNKRMGYDIKVEIENDFVYKP